MKRNKALKEVKGSPSQALITGTLAFFIGFAAVALFGTTAHKISSILHLSIVEIGWLVAIPLVTGSLLRIPFSALVEKYGGKRIILIQLIIALIGMIGIVITLTLIHKILYIGYFMLILFGALAGTGISAFSSGITYVSYWFSLRKQGLALGLFAGIGNTAPGIFTAILPIALICLGLIGAYVIWSLILVVGLTIFAIFGIDAYYFQLRKIYKEKTLEEAKKLGEEIIPTDSALTSLSNALRIWKVWLLVIMYLTSFGGFEALTEWLPTYWQEFLHVNIVEAGLLVGVLFSLIAALIRVLGGWLSDIFGGENVSLVAYIILLLGSLITLDSFKFTQSIIGEIIMALGMGIANGAVFKLVPKYAYRSVGGASGLVGGLGSFGGLLLPPIMAYIVNVIGISGFAYGFIVFTSLSLVSIIFTLILKRRSDDMNIIQ
ncbi:nitrate/nitrite transporter [Sulfurisphaera javensis]